MTLISVIRSRNEKLLLDRKFLDALGGQRLRVDGAVGTADFDLPLLVPIRPAYAVASII
jgi:hypothetical protein